VDPSGKIIFGIVWCITGLAWVYRARRQEGNPNTPISLFVESEEQSEKDRAWKMRLGVLNVMLGGVQILFGVFSYHH
jgi:hypothetical protein